MKEYKIYGLRLKNQIPGTEEFRYIGCTTTSLKKRLIVHIADKRCNFNGKYDWINENKSNIEIFLIEEFEHNKQYASHREVYWIEFYRNLGNKLFNGTNGGLGGQLGINMTDNLKNTNRIYMLNNNPMKNPEISNKVKLHNSIPVLQLDLSGNLLRTFNSGREAARFLGSNSFQGSIGKCINGKLKTAYGFIWKKA